MTKRMTAEEVVAQFEGYGAIARGSWDHAAQIVCDNLVPQWQDEPDEDTNAACPWWWLENLSPDSPPQKLRSYRPMKFNNEDSTYSVSLDEPRKWDVWTVAGWVPLVGRVGPVGARPQ